MKTHAAILVEPGKPLEIGELEVPPAGPGQVLVEVAFSGVCRTQLLETRGLRGPDAYLPHCLGHEGSGTVIEVGDRVTKVARGDRVVLSWIKGSGADVAGTVYGWGKRKVNAGGVTTFMRHALASENRVTGIADTIDMKEAALLGCALPTGMGAVLNTLAPQPGQSIAVFGVGGVGQCAVMGAQAAGCDPIIAIDPNPAMRALARNFGATATVDPHDEDAVEAVRRLTDGGADFAVEAAGITIVMLQALEAVRPRGGRAVVIGNAPKGDVMTVDPGLFNAGKSLMGTWGGDTDPDRDQARFAGLVAAGRHDLSRLLSAPYRLEAINDALADLEGGRVGRPIIAMKV